MPTVFNLVAKHGAALGDHYVFIRPRNKARPWSGLIAAVVKAGTFIYRDEGILQDRARTISYPSTYSPAYWDTTMLDVESNFNTRGYDYNYGIIVETHAGSLLVALGADFAQVFPADISPASSLALTTTWARRVHAKTKTD